MPVSWLTSAAWSRYASVWEGWTRSSRSSVTRAVWLSRLAPIAVPITTSSTISDSARKNHPCTVSLRPNPVPPVMSLTVLLVPTSSRPACSVPAQ